MADENGLVDEALADLRQTLENNLDIVAESSMADVLLEFPKRQHERLQKLRGDNVYLAQKLKDVLDGKSH